MGKSPQTFGGRGVNPDDFAGSPHDMEEHGDGVAADGDPQPPQEHGDAAHAIAYLAQNDYRVFINDRPADPQDGDKNIVPDGTGGVTEEVYDSGSGDWVGTASSADEYTDSDAVNAVTEDLTSNATAGEVVTVQADDSLAAQGVTLQTAEVGDAAEQNELAVSEDGTLLIGSE